MTLHMFCDESKHPTFLLVASVASPRQLTAGRSAMRGMLMPGQDRLHFTKERDSRRCQILSAIATTEIVSVVYDCSGIKDLAAARRASLEAVIDDAAASRAHRLVIEQDETLVAFDRRVLYAQTLKTGCGDTLTYEHLRAKEEPLLWVPDALAWCWAKGGHWRDKARPMISEVRKLT